MAWLNNTKACNYEKRNEIQMDGRETNTTPAHGMPGTQADQQSLSYALSAAASISSDALPVGKLPSGVEEE